MILFFDTSVLIPAFLQTHVHHERSNNALAKTAEHSATCGAHTLAEFYSVLTRLPSPHRLDPDQALFGIEQIAGHFQIITLNSDEYLNELRRATAGKTPGGQIYDALLLSCARKANADQILTWNVKHFQALAPDLANRIVTP